MSAGTRVLSRELIMEWVRLARERAPERCILCNKVMVRGVDVGYNPLIRGCDDCQAAFAIWEFELAKIDGRIM